MFNIGDRVIYTSENHGDTRNNPLWKGRYGKIAGIITDLNAEPISIKYWISVLWDNGKYNVYHNEDIELYKQQIQLNLFGG